jgi:hypothetical protein
MRAVEALRRIVRGSDRVGEISQGIANQSSLLNRKLDAVIEGLENQSQLLDAKLSAVIDGLAKQSKTNSVDPLIQALRSQTQLLAATLSAVTEGLDTRSQINQPTDKLEEVLRAQSQLLESKFSVVIQRMGNQSEAANEPLAEIAKTLGEIVELQKGQLVMHREQTEAIDELITTVKERDKRSPPPLLGASQRRRDAERASPVSACDPEE